MVAEKRSFCSGRWGVITEEAVRVVEGVEGMEGEGHLIWEKRNVAI